MLGSCSHKRCVLIRPKERNNLVLDGGDREVKLKLYDGSLKQIWKLVCSDLGRYMIVNDASGNAMSLELNAKAGCGVYTSETHGGILQQWFVNNDDTIVSAEDSWALDVREKKHEPGIPIVVSKYVTGRGQKFLFTSLDEGVLPAVHVSSDNQAFSAKSPSTI